MLHTLLLGIILVAIPLSASDASKQENASIDVESQELSRIFNGSQARLPRQEVKNLHLYQLLKPVDRYLKDAIDQKESDDSEDQSFDALLKASAICSQTITSMEKLVMLFNTKAYEAISQFRWQFLSVCQTLKEHGSQVKPRHLRKLAIRVKKLHTAIFDYFYKHKEFMDDEENALFNEMNSFCTGLRFCLLPGSQEYFSLEADDLLADFVFFRPLEIAMSNKIATAGALIAIAGGIWLIKKAL